MQVGAAALCVATQGAEVYCGLHDHSVLFFFITLKPRVERYTKSVSLKYEPASEPLHILAETYGRQSAGTLQGISEIFKHNVSP